MKAVPYALTNSGYERCDSTKATHVHLNTPGPIPYRMIPVIQYGTRDGTPCWTWNGDTSKPTLRPSILTRLPTSDGDVVCHSFVQDGRIRFLDDCTHDLAGQEVDLLEEEES